MKQSQGLCWLLAVFVCLCFSSALAEEPLSFSALLPARDGQAEVSSIFLEDEDVQSHWLFLPSFADLQNLHIQISQEGWLWPWGETVQDGQSVNVPARFEEPEPGIFSAFLSRGDEYTELRIMQSAQVRTLFFFSDDPENQGREWVEDSPSHTRHATGSMALVDEDGVVNHSIRVESWRGRGNSTWRYLKKPYQFKLEHKADLLRTGLSQESSRTWVLLSDVTDKTLLRNRIAFDLALELGMEETSLSEYVDLYYDGEYRGLYLLSEKVQVENGRVEILDYDQLIESWNEAAGQYNLAALPSGTDTNAYGLPYTYTQGLIDTPDPAAGGYLLELESDQNLSDSCYFTLGDGRLIALKNPEYASSNMMTFISEKMETLRRALENHGTDPQTGMKAEDLMDIEAFARITLLHELGYNRDGFSYSSSYFVLPEGSGRFRPGPAWDFDSAFQRIKTIYSDGYSSFKPNGWLQLFYGVPAFRNAMQRILQEELAPLVRNVLLGEQRGRYLQSIDDYAALVTPAMRMSQRQWSVLGDPITPLESQVASMKQIISQRLDWLYPRIMAWEQETANVIELQADASYLLMEETFHLTLARWSNGRLLEEEFHLLTEATEESYAVWHLEARVAPLDGFSFSGSTRAFFNDTEVPCQLQKDGTLLITALYQDFSYKPAYAYGEDIGMVYEESYFIEHYSDIAEECGYDSTLMAEYFYDYCMLEGWRGNEFFSPRDALRSIPELDGLMGDMWADYYWEFIYGEYQNWIPEMNVRYVPAALSLEETLPLLESN